MITTFSTIIDLPIYLMLTQEKGQLAVVLKLLLLVQTSEIQKMWLASSMKLSCLGNSYPLLK